jgi:hypothetical protein
MGDYYPPESISTGYDDEDSARVDESEIIEDDSSLEEDVEY